MAAGPLETQRNVRFLVIQRAGDFSCKFNREIDGNFSKTIITDRPRHYRATNGLG